MRTQDEATNDATGEAKQPVRLSVVLDEKLAEHVRRRAYETRSSRSAYVRSLVENDAQMSSVGFEGDE